jgi:hypothetical protein
MMNASKPGNLKTNGSVQPGNMLSSNAMACSPTLKASLPLLLLVAVAICLMMLLEGCGVFRAKPKPPKPVVFSPPLEKIRVAKPPVEIKVPREAYQIFKPGTQTITVGKRGGYYFTAPKMDHWIMWRGIALDRWSTAMFSQIEKHNQSIKEWQQELDTLKKRN